MAEGFPECDGKEVQELKANAENANTKKSTKTWITPWSICTESKGFNPDIMSYSAKELDKKLDKYFAEVRNAL